MFEPLESMFETSGFDEQARSRYSMEAFFCREIDSAPRYLYDYWDSLPSEPDGLPRQALCRPKEALPEKFAGWVSWIDTVTEDPMRFKIWEHRECSIPGMGTELSGQMLCDIPEAPLHISACAIEYLYCKHERVPMYHEIEQVLCGFRRHYTRILVPATDESGAVSRIYCAARVIGEPVRVDAIASGIV